ncbi:MAG: AAA family ATPase [Segetibacter sp.]
MDYIEIQGYKSIKMAKIEFKPINILIGANGSGKSNFISFFEFLNKLYEKNLKEYIALKGGAEKILHKGSDTTTNISAKIEFDNGLNGYLFTIEKGEDTFIFRGEHLLYRGDRGWDSKPVIFCNCFNPVWLRVCHTII